MSARMTVVIGGLVAVLVAVAFFFLLWQPRSEEQTDLEEQIAGLQARQAQLRNEITQLEEIQANEVQIRAALARLEDFIPTGTAQPTAIRQLQLSADAAGVVITSVSFGGPALAADAPDTADPATALANIPVTIVTQGGYFQMVDFFRRLEVDVPRAVLMQTVSMGEGEASFPELSTTWGGQLFAVVPIATAEVAPTPDDEPDDDDDDDDDDDGDADDAENGADDDAEVPA